MSLSVFSRFDGSRSPIYSNGGVHESSYYAPSCPNDVENNNKTLEVVKSLLKNQPDYLVLEELHYPSFWRCSQAELLDSCYCTSCVEKFRNQKLYGEQLPNDLQALVDIIDGSFYIDWLEYKCSVVTEMLLKVKELVSILSPNTKLCAVVPSWKEKHNGSGLKRLLGIDLDVFSAQLDYVLYDQKFQSDFDTEDYKEFLLAIGPNLLQFDNIFRST